METPVKVSDKKIWDIIPCEAEVSRIAGGFAFTEGPVWCGDYLLFSDIRQNRIVKLQILSYGPEVTTFRNPSGNSNGLALDVSGRLIACHHSLRSITRTETDGSISVLASRYQGKRLNSPNDVVVRSDGSIYFTDPPYGLKGFTTWKELGFNGVFRFSPNGELILLVDDFERPNGLAFSPDESLLYINDTGRKHIRAFDVATDGSISNSRIFIEMQGSEQGSPDGMKVDLKGNVYCTGPGGIWIMNSEGKCLGQIVIPEIPANLAFGGPLGKTLYITARSSIYCMPLNTSEKSV
ncbi:SMP-30/gluconolactonase/LRE family protein [Chloroflexota bacterium]